MIDLDFFFVVDTTWESWVFSDCSKIVLYRVEFPDVGIALYLLSRKFHIFPSVYSTSSGNALAYTPTYLNFVSMTSTFVNEKTCSYTYCF